MSSTPAQYAHYAVQYLIELRVRNASGTVDDNALIACEQTIGPNAAALIESA
jgi:hypothetical protein